MSRRPRALGWVVGRCSRAGSLSRWGGAARWALLGALLLEVAQGLVTPLLDPSDLIRPFALSF